MALKGIVIGRVYQNIKNKQKYVVADIGFHTELEEITVHYKPLYDAPFKDYYRPVNGPNGFKNKFMEIGERSNE